MRKNYVVMLATILISASTFAQKGNTQIAGGVDLSFPAGDLTGYVKAALGIYTKAMFGVGTAGQVTFTSGYSNFRSKTSIEINRYSFSVIPLLIGYRHYFNGFFVEPQLGYSAYNSKYSDDVEYTTASWGAFTWAAGVGYVFNNKVEVSARYQRMSYEGESDGVVGLRVGYNFSLGGSKKN